MWSDLRGNLDLAKISQFLLVCHRNEDYPGPGRAVMIFPSMSTTMPKCVATAEIEEPVFSIWITFLFWPIVRRFRLGVGDSQEVEWA